MKEKTEAPEEKPLPFQSTVRRGDGKLCTIDANGEMVAVDGSDNKPVVKDLSTKAKPQDDEVTP